MLGWCSSWSTSPGSSLVGLLSSPLLLAELASSWLPDAELGPGPLCAGRQGPSFLQAGGLPGLHAQLVMGGRRMVELVWSGLLVAADGQADAGGPW